MHFFAHCMEANLKFFFHSVSAAEAEHGYAVSLPPTLMYEPVSSSVAGSGPSGSDVITQPQVQQQPRSAPIAFHGKFSQNNNTVILASSAPAFSAPFHGINQLSILNRGISPLLLFNWPYNPWFGIFRLGKNRWELKIMSHILDLGMQTNKEPWTM